MQFSTSVIAAAAAFFPLVSAHCKMVKPAPYSFNIDNSPLDASGSNFPCKMPQGYSGGAEPANGVPYVPGVPNTFEIQGGATHGGGSCQISITYDNPPTKNSKFKVVQSYEGGCPILAAGNVNGDASNPLPAFKVTFPEGLKKGPATFVWTWFNKIGNREMYMNCAPIMIGGSGTSDDVFNSLPDMFVANIGVPQSKCTTDHGKDIIFPNPGKNVVRNNSPDCKFAPACPGGPGADTGSGGSSGGDVGGSYGPGAGSSQDTPAGPGAGSSQDTPAGPGAGGSYGPGAGSSQGSGSNDGSYNPGAGSSQGSGSNDGYPGGIFVGITTTIDSGAPAATYTPIDGSPSTTMSTVLAQPTNSYGNGGSMGGGSGGSMGGGYGNDSPAGGNDSSNDGSSNMDNGNMGGNGGSGNVSAPATGETCDGSWIIKCESDDAPQFTLCYGKNQMAQTFDCSAGTTCADMKAGHPGGYKSKFKRTAREHTRRMAHKHHHRF